MAVSPGSARGTGSTFALLPRRTPRQLDQGGPAHPRAGGAGAAQLAAHQLRVGLSMEATVMCATRGQGTGGRTSAPRRGRRCPLTRGPRADEAVRGVSRRTRWVARGSARPWPAAAADAWKRPPPQLCVRADAAHRPARALGHARGVRRDLHERAGMSITNVSLPPSPATWA